MTDEQIIYILTVEQRKRGGHVFLRPETAGLEARDLYRLAQAGRIRRMGRKMWTGHGHAYAPLLAA